jgi:hypothetical protein
MKTLKFVMLITLTMFTGCAVTADAPTSESTEDTSIASTSTASTSTASDELTLTPAIACNGVEQACTTGFNCHHQEGRNIGILGCPSGQICCQF